MSSIQHAVAAAVLTLAVPAFAQGEAETNTYDNQEETRTQQMGTDRPSETGVVPAEDLPPARSDRDPIPPAARTATNAGLVKQAGVGGQVAYGRAGVVELGGSAAFTSAANFANVQVNPSIGWFFQDNLQISGIVGVNFSQIQGQSTTFFTVLAEPSYHSDRRLLETGVATARGAFRFVLVNAQHLKNVPGRKTDVADATWLADLLAHGLVRSSFIPPAPIQELRDLTRTRKQLVRELSQQRKRCCEIWGC